LRSDLKEIFASRHGEPIKFANFIPTFHQNLGRQLKISNFGYTKLINLLEAVSDIVKIQGSGENRNVTLISEYNRHCVSETKKKMLDPEIKRKKQRKTKKKK